MGGTEVRGTGYGWYGVRTGFAHVLTRSVAEDIANHSVLPPYVYNQEVATKAIGSIEANQTDKA